MFRWLALSCLLLWALMGPRPAEGATADPSSFMQALRATRVGPSATDAMGLVGLLKEMGKPEQAEALQRELLHVYLASLNGAPPEPQLTVGQAIDRGAARRGEPDAAAWQPVYAQIGFEWQGVTTQLPPSLQPLAARAASGELVRAGPGLWAMSGPRLRMYLTLRVRNSGLQALPMLEPSLQLGSGAAVPPLLCRADSPATSNQRAEPRVLASGATRELICQIEGDASLRDTLPTRVADARLGEIKAVLRATEAETAEGRARLAAWLVDGKRVPRDWSEAWGKALSDPQKQWIAGSGFMAAPAPKPTLRQRWAKRSDGVVAALAITFVTLGLFGFGRMLRRLGWPPPVVFIVGTLAVLAVLAVAVPSFMSLVGPNPTAGDGWNRPIMNGLVLVFYLSFVVPGLAVLIWLHRLLDAEDLSWAQTVASGWLRAGQWVGTATRAEFWGFAVHGAWLWALARYCMPPLDWLVLALLLPPMAALMSRRWRSLTTPEIIGMTLVLALVVLELAAAR